MNSPPSILFAHTYVIHKEVSYKRKSLHIINLGELLELEVFVIAVTVCILQVVCQLLWL